MTLNDIKHPANICLLTTNIAFFIVFQCIFFYYFGCKQYDNMLKKKANFVKGFLHNSPLVGPVTCAKISEFIEKNKDEAIRQELERNRFNKKLLKNEAAKFVLPCVIIAIFAFIIAKRRNIWGSEHNISLVLISACFITELFIYKGVFKTYNIVGDYELLNMLYKSKFKED